MVANALREQILTGDLIDGKELPNQDRLVAEFGVSKQAVRDGLRILELEGLITVRRGNVGGAVVHMPTYSGAAYSVGLVLQSQGVHVAELGSAMGILEPLCAQLCAARPDRQEKVVPTLRSIQEGCVRDLEDVPRFLQGTSRFHSAIVSNCGNLPVAVVVGAIEEIWLAQVKEWGAERTKTGTFPDLDVRRANLDVHQRMIDLIESGDEVAVFNLASGHYHPEQFYTETLHPDQRVLVSLLQQPANDGVARSF